MIHVLALNPALDRTLSVSSFTVGGVHRASLVHIAAGGKPLDVARVLRRLGRPVQVIGFLGGLVATPIQIECDALGIEQTWIPIGGETRTCSIVMDPVTSVQTVINEAGPEIEPQEMEAVRDAVLAAPSATWIFTGSLPPGLPANTYAQLIVALRERGSRVFLDTSGAALPAGLESIPWAIKPAEHELRDLPTVANLDVEDAAKVLRRYAQYICVTRGEHDVIFADAQHLCRATPPQVRVVNTVGSGDAFVAGFVAGLEDHGDPLEALRLAVACGASNATLPHADIGSQSQVAALAAGVMMQRLEA